MPAYEYINKDQVLFHGTSGQNVQSILKTGLKPSSDRVIAGIPGVYLTTSDDTARGWGDHVITVSPTRRLKIHGDIEDNPHLENQRRTTQALQDYHDFGASDPQEWLEYHGAYYGLDSSKKRHQEVHDWAKANTNTENVADTLSSWGYHGNRDSIASHDSTPDVTIYNPRHLRVTGVNGPSFT